MREGCWLSMLEAKQLIVLPVSLACEHPVRPALSYLFALSIVVMDASKGVQVRRAKREDCAEIRRLIQELADFENMPEGPKVNAKELERDGFDQEPPLYRCLVGEDNGCLVGYVLCYSSYSTWNGQSLYMEDLYVTPSHRKTGLGKALFAAAAKEAVDAKCNRLDFAVLNWNPAQEFYAHFGAVDMNKKEGWTPYRVEGEALAALARLA